MRGSAYLVLQQFSSSKADLEQAAKLYQKQNNQPRYQAVVALIQQLAPLIK
jgi:hypothetical protein